MAEPGNPPGAPNECRVVRDGIERPGMHTLGTYTYHGGYEALKVAAGYLAPEAVIGMVAESGLSGRGGAGFPTGRKWQTVRASAGSGGRPWVVANGDESEPGAFKDRELMEKLPHRILEGALIAACAVGADQVTLFVRGEYELAYSRLEGAVAEATQAGIIGRLVPVNVHLHRSAGAYICGEETALIEALEDRRPMPRGKPPYPAVQGLHGRPTLVNNMETLANVPAILTRGPAWYRRLGVPDAPGTRVFSVSGLVTRPGNYECEIGVTLDDLIHGLAGGVRAGHHLKAVIPGGTSTPVLPADHIGVRMTPADLAAAGSMLGTASVIVYDDSACMVDAARNMARFYRDESCGKCTPCRDGTEMLFEILSRFEDGGVQEADIERLFRLCDYTPREAVCALGSGAVAPVLSTLTHFRAEYDAHLAHGGCPVRREYEVDGVCFPVTDRHPGGGTDPLARG
jgi:NADH-quinone oxidoreductase subunit F